MSELLVAVLTSLGWAILHSLWIALIVGLAYAILSKCFPQRLNLRYHAGGLALMIILLSSVGVFIGTLAEHWPATMQQARAASPLVMLNAKLASVESDDSMAWTTLLGLIWLLGAALSAWRLWRSHRLLRTMAQQAVYSDTLQHLARELSAQLRLHLPVRVAVSEWIDVPCVIGLLKPLVLVPTALVARLPADQMELILLHELSHVKNGDLWVNALQIVIEVVMFFHPAVHWISADLRALRERRCDRSVLAVRPIPVRYAQTLLRLEEFRQEFRGLAIAANGGELSTRVRDILMPRLNAPSSRSNHGAAMLSAVALTALLAGSVTQMMAPRMLDEHITSDRREPTPPSTPSSRAPIATPARTSTTTHITPTTSVLPESPKAVVADIQAQQERALKVARHALRSTTARSTRGGPILLASLSTIDVADFATPESPSEPLLDDDAWPTTPRLIHQVNPVFRPGAALEYHFSMSFKLDERGVPRDIQYEKGSATAAQIEAASEALAKWRFDPSASAEFGDRRLAQAFNFKEIERPCVQVIGSRICRRVAR